MYEFEGGDPDVSFFKVQIRYVMYMLMIVYCFNEGNTMYMKLCALMQTIQRTNQHLKQIHVTGVERGKMLTTMLQLVLVLLLIGLESGA